MADGTMLEPGRGGYAASVPVLHGGLLYNLGELQLYLPPQLLLEIDATAPTSTQEWWDALVKDRPALADELARLSRGFRP